MCLAKIAKIDIERRVFCQQIAICPSEQPHNWLSEIRKTSAISIIAKDVTKLSIKNSHLIAICNQMAVFGMPTASKSEQKTSDTSSSVMALLPSL